MLLRKLAIQLAMSQLGWRSLRSSEAAPGLPCPCVMVEAIHSVPPALMLAGAKQAEEILGKNALEVAALYDQLCVIRFLYERMEEATEAGKLCCVNATNYAATTPIVPPRPLPAICRCVTLPA